MIIRIDKQDEITHLEISGSVESSGMKEFQEIVSEICSNPCPNIELNLDEVDYMDSSGISLLLKLHKNCKQNEKNFSIVKASERVKSLLTLCSLHDTLIQEDS